MLEVNIFDNFNPNKFLYNNGTVLSGFNTPRARSVIINYELFETGYEFTSTGIIPVKDLYIGDCVEVLLQGEYSYTKNGTNVVVGKRSIWYVITDIDENNKVTLMNYFWYFVEGNEFPTFGSAYNNAEFLILQLTTATTPTVMRWFNEVDLQFFSEQKIRQNIKSETADIKSMLVELFRITGVQPITISRYIDYAGARRIGFFITPDVLPRKITQTRLDINQNVSMEEVIVTQRSNYNTLRIFWKETEDGDFLPQGETYTLKTDGTVQKISQGAYVGTGEDLPSLRKIKTMFYDQKPTIAEIRSEITGDTTTKKIYFNQNPLQPLKINEYVGLWYEGSYYSGFIVEIIHLESGEERCVFLENEVKQ